MACTHSSTDPGDERASSPEELQAEEKTQQDQASAREKSPSGMNSIAICRITSAPEGECQSIRVG